MNPAVAESARFVVWRDGQERVQKDGKHRRLTAAVARAKLAKLEQSAG